MKKVIKTSGVNFYVYVIHTLPRRLSRSLRILIYFFLFISLWNPPTNWMNNRKTNTIIQPINQPTNQPTNQATNGSLNQWKSAFLYFPIAGFRTGITISSKETRTARCVMLLLFHWRKELVCWQSARELKWTICCANLFLIWSKISDISGLHLSARLSVLVSWDWQKDKLVLWLESVESAQNEKLMVLKLLERLCMSYVCAPVHASVRRQSVHPCVRLCVSPCVRPSVRPRVRPCVCPLDGL